MKVYTVSFLSANPGPNEVNNELNNYASLGWTFKTAITNSNGHVMLIFERNN